jgi:hypothetical protein
VRRRPPPGPEIQVPAALAIGPEIGAWAPGYESVALGYLPAHIAYRAALDHWRAGYLSAGADRRALTAAVRVCAPWRAEEDREWTAHRLARVGLRPADLRRVRAEAGRLTAEQVARTAGESWGAEGEDD